MPLKDKVAIISGAGRGIGRAIAQELAAEGVHIAFSYLKNSSAAEGLEKELCGLAVKAKASQVDIRDAAAVRGWVQETKDFFGRLDILVNNAGVINDKALMFMTQEDWQEVMDTNLNGVFNLTQAAITGFLKQRSGDIVNITSVSGITGIERQTNYSASKAGLIGFTKSLAREVARYNIRVNAVAAGFIQTEMLDSLKEDYKKKMRENIPLARFGRPQEVAQAVRFLLSDAANYITGQTLVIDGGMSINLAL